MPGISIHYDIRVAVSNQIIAACGGGQLTLLPKANVKVRLMPKVGEVVDPLPCVIIAPVERISWQPLGFEGSVTKQYGVEVAIVAAANQNYLANQELWEGWLRAIGLLLLGDLVTILQNTNPPCPTVWNAMIDHEATFDRSKLAINYSYQSLLAVYDSQEMYY